MVTNRTAPLRQQVAEVMRFFHYSQRTEEAYWQWVVRYLRFYKRPGVAGAEGWRHPRELGAASTQNQALNALVFRYAAGLHQPLGEPAEFARASMITRRKVFLPRHAFPRATPARATDRI